MSVDAANVDSVREAKLTDPTAQILDTDGAGEVPGSLLTEVLSQPRRIWSKACRAIAGRNRVDRKQPLRKASKKQKNENRNNTSSVTQHQSRHVQQAASSRKNKKLVEKRAEFSRTARKEVHECLADELRERAVEVTTAEEISESVSKGTEATEWKEELEESRSRDSSPLRPGQRDFYCLYRAGPCGMYPCRCNEASPYMLDHHPGSIPGIAVGVGRSFGRVFIPSGSVLLHTAPPTRHLDVLAARELAYEERPPMTRAVPTAPRLGSHPRSKTIPKRTPGDTQRPHSVISQSASSPLNHEPIRRIDDRHDVLTPDEYFDTEAAAPPFSTVEDSVRERLSWIPPHTEPRIPIPDVGEYVKRVSDLQLELQLLKTETEIQRREREKYQRLYESAALCQICMERRRNSFILPCSHFVYCDECLDRHWEGTDYRRCPLCRGPAHSVIITNLVY